MAIDLDHLARGAIRSLADQLATMERENGKPVTVDQLSVILSEDRKTLVFTAYYSGTDHCVEARHTMSEPLQHLDHAACEAVAMQMLRRARTLRRKAA